MGVVQCSGCFKWLDHLSFVWGFRCEGRTDRMVNPLAWERGTVFVQCSGCEVWHKLKDNMNLIDEIRYADVAEE